MESHIMNVPYHQARYRTIGHKIMRTTSHSLSSESSCNQNSPEYKGPDPEYENHYEGESNEVQHWQTQTVVSQSSQDTSDDDVEEEGEQIEVQEVQYEVRDTDSLVYDVCSSEAENIEDTSLIEGADYDIIQVYAVDPNLDLEASDEDEEQTDYVVQNYTEAESEYVNPDDTHFNPDTYDQKSSDILQETLNIDLDTPVVSNVDEYFIKVDKDKDILEVKDEPVVQDVDEYFIKDAPPKMPNIEDFITKHKVPEEDSTIFCIDKPRSGVDELFPQTDMKKFSTVQMDQQQNVDISINESDLEVLPNVEELKKFLMEDMPCTKIKNAQRSCSLPHSPINICMDIDDAKTCLSFEDLNLDLSDLGLDKSDTLANKSDDLPRTLTEEDVNSFLITCKNESKSDIKNEDNLCLQDMEIERPVESSVVHKTPVIMESRTSTPKKHAKQQTVFDFCVEKTSQPVPVKKELMSDIKTELDDFIDVESCNDTVVPVLEANNLNSLLEQFEATEKLNTKTKRVIAKTEEQKIKSMSKTSLTNGMRLQDAGVQLNKNKMRHILMPSTINTTMQRSPSPVHSDHDYCTSKKRHSLPNLKRGQSLLKPEVLSSNSRILNSRHRSCKDKKIVYNLSSDDESEKWNNNNTKNKKNVNNRDDSDVKFKKLSIKQPVKPLALATCRKKLSPPHNVVNDNVAQATCRKKLSLSHSLANDSAKNISVINKSASKASDTPCSQNSNGSIKLTIKNKSEVILSCDHKNSHKIKHSEKSKNNSVSDKSKDTNKLLNNAKEIKVKEVKNVKNVKEVEVSNNKTKPVLCKEPVTENVVNKIAVKEEPQDNFYTALFANKQDVQIPATMIKTEKRPFDEELQRISEVSIKKEIEQPQKKKKLNLQEYKMRRVNSNNSSTTVSPEAIFPDLPHLNLDKTVKSTLNQIPNGIIQTKTETNTEPKKIFDPIREASRKILMHTMKQKARRKRDEDIVKIPKVENLQLQPLISDAEMMKIVGMTPVEVLPIPVAPEKPPAPADHEEIILVSIGINTDEDVFKRLESMNEKRKSISPPAENKSLINFRIKKSDHVLKQNVFESIRKDKHSIVDEKKQEPRIDKERYKDITAALKKAEKQVDPKISSNSLFASIQDVVMKKAPEEMNKGRDKTPKPSSPTEKKMEYKYVKTTIIREYDVNADHGEDKVILHLRKDRSKPTYATVVVQTHVKDKPTKAPIVTKTVINNEVPAARKRTESDMSMSSEGSPVRRIKSPKQMPKVAVKPKEKTTAKRSPKRSLSKEKRSRSKDRHEAKHRRRSRSHSRSRRRRRSRSRSRSRSGGRYKRYRRSDSPYRRKRRSRSPYRRRISPRRSPSVRRLIPERHSPVHRRSPSIRLDHRRSHSRPRRTKSPIPKKLKPSPQGSVEKTNLNNIKPKSLTPPLRKATVSESSDSSTSSSSSSSTSSSSSSSAESARRSCSPYKRDETHRNVYSYSSEDRESNTPVEERRIVFVGKLEKDLTKIALRNMFSKFGSVMEVRLHSKEDGTRYGFVTYQRARDAWSAVEAAGSFPQYDVGFGGRRAFCRHSYADLDGLEAKYTESAFHGQAALPTRRTDDMSFEQMLLEMKKKLSQRKGDKKRQEDDNP